MFYDEKLTIADLTSRKQIHDLILGRFKARGYRLRLRGLRHTFDLTTDRRAMDASALSHVLRSRFGTIVHSLIDAEHDLREAYCFLEWHGLHPPEGRRIGYLAICQLHAQNAIVRLCSTADLIAQCINARYNFYPNERNVTPSRILDALRLSRRNKLSRTYSALLTTLEPVSQWRNIIIHRGGFKFFDEPSYHIEHDGTSVRRFGIGHSKGDDPQKVLDKVFDSMVSVVNHTQEVTDILALSIRRMKRKI